MNGASGHHEQRANGQISGQISAMPLPLSNMPRTTLQEMGDGKDFADATAPRPGMPRNGNAKPDTRMEGRRKNTIICIACSWFWATVEKV